jgi:hypothetical protein
VPGFILLTFWCLIVPFIVLGRSGVFESFGNSWRTVRGYAWRVFGTYVLVFLILIAFAIVVGFVLMLLPLWLRSFVNNLVSGTLIAPFLALVATLIYYRLTAAHAGQPYTPTGPAGAKAWEPPHPTTTPSPADSPAPPADSTPGPAAPGSTRPHPTPGPTELGPTEPRRIEAQTRHHPRAPSDPPDRTLSRPAP